MALTYFGWIFPDFPGQYDPDTTMILNSVMDSLSNRLCHALASSSNFRNMLTSRSTICKIIKTKLIIKVL